MTTALAPSHRPVRYRFGPFVLSPRGRTLARDGSAVPLIPKYFDLLVLLVERHAEAVSKADIFAVVWSDVIVSDGALAQAVRTLRRALGDDPRQPRFIRTVSRHGYQFVAADLRQEPDGPTMLPSPDPSVAPVHAAGAAAEIATAVDRLLTSAAAGATAAGEARDAAAQLLELGTAEAVAALKARPGHARALAYLRDARWDLPAATDVPLAGDTELAHTALEVVRMRWAEGAPLVAARVRAGAMTGTVVGALAGLAGGAVLLAAPGTTATPPAAIALAVVGGLAGDFGVAALVAGAAAAEVVDRSRRPLVLVLAATAAVAAAGGIAHLVVRTLLDGLFALRGVTIPGLAEATALGAAVSGAYAGATWGQAGGGLPTPRGWHRAVVVAATAVGGVVAGVCISAAGGRLVGGLVEEIARASGDAPLALAPLARFIGEPAFGPITQAVLAAFEGGMFGVASGLALTQARRSAAISANAHPPLNGS